MDVSSWRGVAGERGAGEARGSGGDAGGEAGGDAREHGAGGGAGRAVPVEMPSPGSLPIQK